MLGASGLCGMPRGRTTLGLLARCRTACPLATLWNTGGVSLPSVGFGGVEGPAIRSHAVGTRL